MDTRDLPVRLLRTAVILIALSCVAAVTPVLAQQAQDAVRAPETSTSSTTLPGPRLSPEFQRFEPGLTRSDAPAGSSALVAAGSHTIVISTLALVLIAVIIVLLI